MSKLLSSVMNYYAVLAIYKFEMARMRRTLLQSIVTPVLTTSLYFIVFGAAIGSRIQEAVTYTNLRAHETVLDLVCRLLRVKN